MKRWVPLLVIAVLVVAALAVRSAKSKRTGEPPRAPRQLEVTTLTANPSAHLGRVLVAGVVGRVDAHRSLVLLVDRAEVRKCGLQCKDEPGKQIPVRWSGALPKIGSEVVAKGRLERRPEGLVLTGGSAGKPTPLRPSGQPDKGGARNRP